MVSQIGPNTEGMLDVFLDVCCSQKEVTTIAGGDQVATSTSGVFLIGFGMGILWLRFYDL